MPNGRMRDSGTLNNQILIAICKVYKPNVKPNLFALEIWLQAVAAKVRDVKTVTWNRKLDGQKLPRPLTNFFLKAQARKCLFINKNLKIVAKRPIAEHLEERVMVAVFANIVKVVVLAAGAYALLRVHGAL